MNTSLRTGTVAAATIVLAAASANAVAVPPRDPAPRADAASVSAYAEPLDALDGRTLAEYLAEYRVNDFRLRR